VSVEDAGVRRSIMRSVLAFLLLTLLPQVESLRAAEPALREATPADVARWKAISQAILTPDGQWLVYFTVPAGLLTGESEVVLRATGRDIERRYPAGNLSLGSANLKMSRSGRSVAFQVAAVAGASERGSLDLVRVDVASGAQRRFKDVSAFEYIGERLVSTSFPGPDGKAFDLRVLDADAEGGKSFPGAMQWAVSAEGMRIAWASAGRAQIYDLRTGSTHVLDAHPDAAYEGLQWSKGGSALAMLRKQGQHTSLIVVRGLEKHRPVTRVYDPSNWAGFPPGFAMASLAEWRDDEKGLFFGVQKLPVAARLGPTVPNLRVWHSRDDHLPGEKFAQHASAQAYSCFVDFSSGRFVRLSDENLEYIEPHRKGRYVLGYTKAPYGRLNKSVFRSMSAINQRRDYYLIDLRTGSRSVLERGLEVQVRTGAAVLPQLSPDGSVLLYTNGAGDILARRLPNGPSRNLTAALPVKFYFPENDPRTGWAIRDNYGEGTPRVQGWSVDGRQVLISDTRDIWALSVEGAAATNLTGDGRERNVWYRRIELREAGSFQSGSASSVDLGSPVYFRTFNLSTGETGLARWRLGQQGARMLHQESAELTYLEASEADLRVMSRQTAAQSPDYYLVGEDGKPGKRLTDVNPEQSSLRWSPGARYLSYHTADGDERHAVLFLPAGYEKGHAYPAVVEIYKGYSAGVHMYREPTSYLHLFLQRGYAVLQPDILPRLNEPGPAALKDVLAGVNAAVATGIVDKERLGLFGHSFGAYETNYIVTQTSLFKAAVAHGGMSNLWSYANFAYADQWPASESGDQPYLSNPWWDDLSTYLKNSPLRHAASMKTPLLLVHGDKDDAVPVGQSIEWFNSLRMLGNAPVVLLEYKGANHDFYDPIDQRDFEARRLAFFNHFLKGEPAPAWWAEGESRYEGQVPAAQ
jgi:dipeptidyl aminopeptidase/acylaminoacyl peptidase